MLFGRPELAPWLAIALAPLVAHLVARRRLRVVPLPTVRFLRQAAETRCASARWRPTLLVLLRCLLLLCLVTAFLRPSLPGALSSEGRTALVLVLDASASMTCRQQGVSAFEVARGRARRLLETLRPGDAACVVLAAEQPRCMPRSLSSALGEARRSLASAAPTLQRCNAQAAIDSASQALLAAPAGRRVLAVASDFQATNWSTVRFTGLPRGTRVVLLPSVEGDRDNGAVWDASQVADGSGEGRLSVELWNGSRRERRLAVSVAGQPSVQAPAAAPFARTTVRTGAPGHAHRDPVSVSIASDDAPYDDTLWVPPAQPVRVALITRQDRNDPQTGAFYLSRAIDPTEGRAGVRLSVFPPERLLALSDGAFDLVFVGGAGAIPPSPARSLAERLLRGAGLVLWLERGDADALAAVAAALPNSNRLEVSAGAWLDRSREGGVAFLQTAAGTSPPLLAPLLNSGAGDLGLLRVRGHYALRAPTGKAAVAARYADGSPAILVHQIGAGRLVVVNAPADPHGSSLAREGLFVALVQRILEWTVSERQPASSVTVGTPPRVTHPSPTHSAFVVAPGGERLPCRWDRTSRTLVVPPLPRPGPYAVEEEGRIVDWVCARVDRAESDLRQADLEPLLRQAPAGSARVSTRSSDPIGEARPLWPFVLALAATLLALEQALAYASLGPSRRREDVP